MAVRKKKAAKKTAPMGVFRKLHKDLTPAPRLCGRPMRRRLSTDGVTIWYLVFGGLTAFVGKDGLGTWFWQIDAWEYRGVLKGETKTCALAVRQVEKKLQPISDKIG